MQKCEEGGPPGTHGDAPDATEHVRGVVGKKRGVKRKETNRNGGARSKRKRQCFVQGDREGKATNLQTGPKKRREPTRSSGRSRGTKKDRKERIAYARPADRRKGKTRLICLVRATRTDPVPTGKERTNYAQKKKSQAQGHTKKVQRNSPRKKLSQERGRRGLSRRKGKTEGPGLKIRLRDSGQNNKIPERNRLVRLRP